MIVHGYRKGFGNHLLITPEYMGEKQVKPICWSSLFFDVIEYNSFISGQFFEGLLSLLKFPIPLQRSVERNTC